MPDGVLQWFDPQRGEAAIVRGSRVYRAEAGAVEPDARHAGARVHFDVRRDEGVDAATHVELRHGTHVSRRQRGFGTLAGARRLDTKGAAPFAHPHPELARELASHPLAAASGWGLAVAAGDLEQAMLFYAPDVVVHAGGAEGRGHDHARAVLEDAEVTDAHVLPEVRGTDGDAVVRWPTTEVRCRVAHGAIVEQWWAPAPAPAVAVAEGTEGPEIEYAVRGEVTDDEVDYALDRIRRLTDLDGPVLFARVRLTRHTDPARTRPAFAEAELDLDGQVVRAHVAAHEMREAIDLLERTMRDRLSHRAERLQAIRHRPEAAEPGEWRHGTPPTERPEWYDRPVEEREIVRHKAFVLDELTVDEAAFDLALLDHDFLLFRDLASGQDALLERTPTGHRLTRLHPDPAGIGPCATDVELSDAPVPMLDVREAKERLDVSGERYVFFADPATDRGRVLYHRYDGHYGLVATA